MRPRSQRRRDRSRSRLLEWPTPFTAKSPQIPSTTGTFFFSWTVALGDYDGNHDLDIAIGSVGERIAGHSYAGAVYVVPSGAHGPRTTGVRRWTRASPGVPGHLGSDAEFGLSLSNGQWSGPSSSI
jgi:FG-GAP repeat